MQAEDYVHRIGRTGRGGSTGTAYSLIGPQDWPLLHRIQKFLDTRYELSEIPGLEPQQPKPSFKSQKGNAGKGNANVRYKRRGKNFQGRKSSYGKRTEAA